MDRLDPTELLGTIVQRAGDLVGTPHGFVYLVDAEADDLVMRVGTGLYADYVGHRLARGHRRRRARLGDRRAAGGRTTTTRCRPATRLSPWVCSASVVGIPLASGGTVIGRPGARRRRLRCDVRRPPGRGPRAGSPSSRRSPSTTPASSRARGTRSTSGPGRRRRCASPRSASGGCPMPPPRRSRSTATGSSSRSTRRSAGCSATTPEACVGRTVLDFAAPETVAAIRAGEFSAESQAPIDGHGACTATARRSRSRWLAPDPVPRRRAGRGRVRPRPPRAAAPRGRAQPLGASTTGLTGLPNRALLLDRVTHALSLDPAGRRRPDRGSSCSTSTASRSSTRASATPPATASSRASAGG